MTYLLRAQHDRKLVVLADTLIVRFHEITKRTPLAGGSFREGTGKFDKNQLELHTRFGGGGRNFINLIQATPDAVKRVLRRLRPQEAAVIQAIDADIEAAKQRVRDLEERRKQLIREAFTRGNVVPLKEVVEMATETLKKRG